MNAVDFLRNRSGYYALAEIAKACNLTDEEVRDQLAGRSDVESRPYMGVEQWRAA